MESVGERQENSGVKNSWDQFTENIEPQIEELAKLAERMGGSKKLAKQAGLLNLTELRKQVEELLGENAHALSLGAEIAKSLEAFQLGRYETDSVAWSAVFIRECQKGGHAVDGEFPSFRVFPLEVKVDFAHDLVLINNRTVRALDPKAAALQVLGQIDKLYRERFNANQFLKALVRAYHIVLHEWQAEHPNQALIRALPLKQIYEVMTIRTGPGGYSLSQFAFDLYRVRLQTLHYGGYHLVLGEGRRAADAVTIPVPGGTKTAFGSLELVPEGETADESQ